MIRMAQVSDAAGCLAVYTPFVEQTAITFETSPPTPDEMRERVRVALERHAWLVLEEDGHVAGYAYAGPFSKRAAYQWSREVSVYVELGRHRTGAGRALYAELFPRLEARGYRGAFAGMTLPNAASEGLHRAMGFEPVGTYRRVGWKFDRWHDVHWMQRPLGTDGTDAGAPEPLH